MMLKEIFERLKIQTKEHVHPPVLDMKGVKEHCGHLDVHFVRNLCLYDKKRRHYLISVDDDTKLDIKFLGKKLTAPNTRFVTEDVMKTLLGVNQGALSPLALINDAAAHVQVVMDQKLKDSTKPLLIHPLHNEASIEISSMDLQRVIAESGHLIIWIDFDAAPAAAVAAAPAATPAKQVDNDLASDASPLGITASKEKNFSDWYTQVIVKGEMIDYYDISGCYIIRPHAFQIWETVQGFLDSAFKQRKVRNAYFPLFVSKARLETEKDHVEGFSAEVAWVTKSGNTDLAEPIAIRPTSETIMYPSYAKWIRSHRDLPLLINQWNAVVRWEFKQPTPFIRTREFLWQEGHTAHATQSEAEAFAKDILGVYAQAYEEVLAVPVIRGYKSEGEKFAGADFTTTVESYVPANGRAVQAATSHFLGTNFSKMFGIEFEDQNKEKQLAYQTSWGFTTRSLGLMVMVHGDDKGLVLPPRVAPVQVVVVPIVYKDNTHFKKAEEIKEQLAAAGVRVELDDRLNYTPGWKYNYWELQGACLRLELGPKDVEKQSVRVVRRDTQHKFDVPWATLTQVIDETLKAIQSEMLEKARSTMNDNIQTITQWDDVLPALNRKRLIMAPWCEEKATEETIKQGTAVAAPSDDDTASQLTGAMKALCIPFDQPEMPKDAKCFVTGKPAKRWCLFGRSY